MANEPKKRDPDIPAKQPDIQPEPRPEEIPQDKDMPEKESPPHAGLGKKKKCRSRSGSSTIISAQLLLTRLPIGNLGG